MNHIKANEFKAFILGLISEAVDDEDLTFDEGDVETIVDQDRALVRIVIRPRDEETGDLLEDAPPAAEFHVVVKQV